MARRLRLLCSTIIICCCHGHSTLQIGNDYE
ncbi:hypothetical protein COLO4_34888 [Corchorus olitorius]|uniref:Uncharacterized protein n=1 Tax=Corchorus olitorius TaxID=93759 RepID=A0A1R3GIZ8_9ROSI|nr:hypothetical protein COLO4_34888 [Corchorus olitorius]